MAVQGSEEERKSSSPRTQCFTVAMSPQLSALYSWLPGTHPQSQSQCGFPFADRSHAFQVPRHDVTSTNTVKRTCIQFAEALALKDMHLAYSTLHHGRGLDAMYKHVDTKGPCLVLLHAQARMCCSLCASPLPRLATHAHLNCRSRTSVAARWGHPRPPCSGFSRGSPSSTRSR